PPSIVEIGTRIVKFCFTTQTHIGSSGLEGHDLWLIAAAAGLITFPVARLRGWLVFWLLVLMWPIFRKQENVSWFFYPATIFWLVKTPRKSMLSHCQTIEGKTNGAWPVPIPHEMFWFDCRWQNAKYLVLASGADASGQQQWGIDLVYTLGVGGAKDVVPLMVE